MAIVNKNGTYQGPLGGVVYRTLKGVNIVQTKPDHLNQSVSTKKASLEFGLCSNTACTLRNVLLGIFNWSDGQMGNRLVKAVRKSFTGSELAMINERDLHDGDLSTLVGLEFNAGSPLCNMLKVKPVVSIEESGLLQVRLPALSPRRDIVFPKSALHIQSSVRVTLIAFNLREDYYQVLEVRETDLPPKGLDGICWGFDHTIHDGCAVLVFMSLQYYVEDTLSGRKNVNGANLNPVELIGAFQFWKGRMSGSESYQARDTNPLPGYKGNDMINDFLLNTK